MPTTPIPENNNPMYTMPIHTEDGRSFLSIEGADHEAMQLDVNPSQKITSGINYQQNVNSESFGRSFVENRGILNQKPVTGATFAQMPLLHRCHFRHFCTDQLEKRNACFEMNHQNSVFGYSRQHCQNMSSDNAVFTRMTHLQNANVSIFEDYKNLMSTGSASIFGNKHKRKRDSDWMNESYDLNSLSRLQSPINYSNTALHRNNLSLNFSPYHQNSPIGNGEISTSNVSLESVSLAGAGQQRNVKLNCTENRNNTLALSTGISSNRWTTANLIEINMYQEGKKLKASLEKNNQFCSFCDAETCVVRRKLTNTTNRNFDLHSSNEIKRDSRQFDQWIASDVKYDSGHPNRNIVNADEIESMDWDEDRSWMKTADLPQVTVEIEKEMTHYSLNVVNNNSEIYMEQKKVSFKMKFSSTMTQGNSSYKK